MKCSVGLPFGKLDGEWKFRLNLYLIIFVNDPLSDGQGCGSSSCCELSYPLGVTPPWFCRQLPQATTDDIELCICGDEGNGDEDTPLELICTIFVAIYFPLWEMTTFVRVETPTQDITTHSLQMTHSGMVKVVGLSPAVS